MAGALNHATAANAGNIRDARRDPGVSTPQPEKNMKASWIVVRP
jgi:hypothetical protein